MINLFGLNTQKVRCPACNGSGHGESMGGMNKKCVTCKGDRLVIQARADAYKEIKLDEKKSLDLENNKTNENVDSGLSKNDPEIKKEIKSEKKSQQANSEIKKVAVTQKTEIKKAI